MPKLKTSIKKLRTIKNTVVESMKVVVLFDRFGPYHVARLKAAQKYLNLYPIEIFSETKEYQWDKVDKESLPNWLTLFEGKANSEISLRQIREGLSEKLNLIRPDVVAVNGWYDKSALTALNWCILNNIPAIIMSESSEDDFSRNAWKEYLKKGVIANFQSGLVGGVRHANYLKKLGMAEENIFFGYDVIDNEYFKKEAQQVRNNTADLRNRMAIPQNYFLAVSRFIEKKNLPSLIKAYNKYREVEQESAWDLCLLGDGPQKSELVKMVDDYKLNDKIHFKGFKQYAELPVFFGLARAFVHVSTTEQWGLVVNEAMAAGLPVIISERCGCVPELVQNGVNGYSFDPTNWEELAQKMISFSNGSVDLDSFGVQSQAIVNRLSPDKFGKGLLGAATAAKHVPKRKTTIKDQLILKSLLLR